MTDQATQFQPGDVVQLKSGGAPMTIERVGLDSLTQEETVWCVWKETVGKREEVHRETFSPVTLKKWQRPGPVSLSRG
jgi:uncharacterized protein YodC (DUF2158 family)